MRSASDTASLPGNCTIRQKRPVRWTTWPCEEYVNGASGHRWRDFRGEWVGHDDGVQIDAPFPWEAINQADLAQAQTAPAAASTVWHGRSRRQP